MRHDVPRRGQSLSRTGRDSALKLSSTPQVPGELPTDSPGPGSFLLAVCESVQLELDVQCSVGRLAVLRRFYLRLLGAYLDARWKPRRGFKFPKQASFNREWKLLHLFVPMTLLPALARIFVLFSWQLGVCPLFIVPHRVHHHTLRRNTIQRKEKETDLPQEISKHPSTS